MVEITSVVSGSRADHAGIQPGDFLISINGHVIRDVLDYRYYLTEKKVAITLHRGPELLEVVIEKPTYADIGLDFATFLMDEKRACRNKCLFCFIDQNPHGMRDTIYFKDDDSRLSFLTGSYVTLTNMSEDDIARIIEMKMSPINISVHTTDPALRCKMLSNRHAGTVLDTMRRFAEGGIEMNAQIVLCRGINDGEALDRTMHDLASLVPSLVSVSVVPAGLTDHREGLYPLSPFTPEECGAVIDQVEAFAAECLEKYDTRLFFPSDEWYIKAKRKIPSEPSYEGYPQLENGVGLIRSLKEEFDAAMDGIRSFDAYKPRHISIATGVAAYDFICSLTRKIENEVANFDCHVYPIQNHFFGENITVAGLITGGDLYRQLRGKNLGTTLFLPAVMLRSDGDRFLDDMTPEELSQKLRVSIRFVKNDGAALLSSLLS